VDGEGTALVTEQVLLNETAIRAHARRDGAPSHGVSRRAEVIWLGEGVVDDETAGHVDNIACFVKPGAVALHWTDNRRDPAVQGVADALERLSAARDARGRRITVIKLPMPGPLKYSAQETVGVQVRDTVRGRITGMRLAASYVNFYIANGGIVMPLLDPRTDKAAAAKIKRAFPGRKVGWRARARNPVRRRQHSLHNTAGAKVSQKTVPRRDIPDRLRVRPGARIKLLDSDADRCFGWRRKRRWPPPPRTSRASKNCNTRCTPTSVSRC
jgi:agmatine/peptidylarginine deiminase